MNSCKLALILTLSTLLALVSCGGGGGSTPVQTSNPQPQATLASIRVSPSSATLAKGRSQQFTATGQYTDNTSKDLTSIVVWTGSPAGLVSISSGGLARSLGEGQVTITATSSSVSGTAQLLVGPADLVTISINAQSSMTLGDVSPVSAMAAYSDGSVQDVSSEAQWTSSNPYVVSVSAGSGVNARSSSANSPQQASGTQVGVAYLSASAGGMTAETKVVVRGYPRFAYVANNLRDSVSGYTVDAATGMLRANGYAFTTTTAFTDCFTVHPSGTFGYAVNSAKATISPLSIAADGSLSRDATLAVRNHPGCVLISPSGKFAFIGSVTPDTITAYTIDATSHALTEVQSVPLPSTPRTPALHPTGRFLYVATDTGILGYAVDSASGMLTAVPGSPFPAWTNGNYIAIEPGGKFAYVPNPNETRMKVFAVATETGALTEVANAIVSTGGINPQVPVFDRGGQFLYVPNELADFGLTTGTIGAFRIDGSTGKLTAVAGSPFPAGQIPHNLGLDIDGLGKYLYVNDGASFVTIYEIDPNQGSLRNAGRMATRTGAGSITVVSGTAPVQYVPTLAWVFDQAGTIETFAFDRTSTLLSTATKTVSAGATSFSVEQRGKWGYVTNPTTKRFDTFNIDPSGIWSDFFSFDLAGRNPTAVAADTANRAVYVTDPLANGIFAFTHLGNPASITTFADPTGTQVALFPTGPAPAAMVTDPSSEYLFVANGDSTVSRYQLSPEFGSPTEITWLGSPSAFAPGVKALAMDRTGQYLYALSSGQLSGYWIDYFNDGLPKAITDFPTVNLNNAVAVATSVSANFLYIADADGVHVYAIDPATGKLTAQGGAVAAGGAPSAMVVDSAGTNLLLVDRALGVQVFAIDSATGALTVRTTVTSGASPLSVAVIGKIQ